MVPRREAGVIVELAGDRLDVMNQQMFSVVIIRVILTTRVTPLF
jgi:hypothetical protein